MILEYPQKRRWISRGKGFYFSYEQKGIFSEISILLDEKSKNSLNSIEDHLKY
jgi:hypothetical protein